MKIEQYSMKYYPEYITLLIIQWEFVLELIKMCVISLNRWLNSAAVSTNHQFKF